MQITREETSIEVKKSKDLKEIEKVFEELLYVPDIRLKPKIMETLLKYLDKEFLDKAHKIKFFIAHNNLELSGFVISQIHPTYTSYGRKCGTFGWLNVKNFEACELLLKKCEIFTRKHGIRKIRGNINFPKGLGGIGIQASGFEEQMMYGVAFNNPETDLIGHLEKLGYEKESEYWCMKVTKEVWDSGDNIDSGIKLRCLTLKELRKLKEEVYDLGTNSFQMDFPDASGAEYRLNEMLDTYAQVPKSHYGLPKGFEPRLYSDVSEFIEAWEERNLEDEVTFCLLAFDRKNGKLVGIIIGLPDLYESWLGLPITRVNIDTAMVRKDCTGRRIFSGLNNFGRKTMKLNGITYFEGTAIWAKNKDAIKSITPHGINIRKHYIMEKRINRSILEEETE